MNRQQINGILLLMVLLLPAVYTISGAAYTNGNNFKISDAPTINHPPDISYEVGSKGHYITWNATDPAPKSYNITRNGTLLLSTSWDGSLITVDVNNLDVGTYIYTCTVMNENNETASDSVTVIVYPDTRAPIIVGLDNITYEYGSEGNKIQWNITESNPDYYNVTMNNTVVEEGDWDGSNISISIDGLTVGNYTYMLWVNDTFGHYSTFNTTVIVVPDLTPPVITPSANLTFEYGKKDQLIEWELYDSNPSSYNITRNGSLIIESQWTQDRYTVRLDVSPLDVGNYTFVIYAYDQYGFSSNSTITVNIYPDVRAPVISSSGNVTYEEGFTGYNVTWYVDETNPSGYNITKDGELYLNNTNWDGSNITISVDGLSVGTHNFTIIMWDIFNQTSNQTTIVIVTPDSILPTIKNVYVIQGKVSETENDVSIQAYVSDLNGIVYVKLHYSLDNNNFTAVNMTLSEGTSHLYVYDLGKFSNGQTIYYYIEAMDNSSVHNIATTPVKQVTVQIEVATTMPGWIWGGLVLLALFAVFVICNIYRKS